MNIIVSVMVLAAIALTIGAIALWRRGGPRKQVALMLLLVAVIAANVAILTIPTSDGSAPLSAKPT
jgi:flagellar biosynthesis/type III secretory pathway M-ring protein FliF/YscJ